MFSGGVVLLVLPPAPGDGVGSARAPRSVVLLQGPLSSDREKVSTDMVALAQMMGEQELKAQEETTYQGSWCWSENATTGTSFAF